MKTRTITAADLFCGAGGSSTGLQLACDELGYKLDLLAINHWDTAIETHTSNHPEASHLCMNVDQVDPHKAVPSGKLDLLIASPECTHHSIARGGKPINDQSRASAWLVLRWAEALDIKNILIENVPEFMTWGPIGTNGRPLQTKKGKTFLAFLNALESLGYTVKHQILNAADYGDPTTRKRLFILARKGRRAVVFPEPTHTPTGASDMFRKTKKWKAARTIIDWTVKGESIFARKKPLSPNTMRRIYAGLEKFSGGAFIIQRNGDAEGRFQTRSKSVDDPLYTVVATNQLHLAEPFLVSLRGTSDTALNGTQRSVEEPVPTLTGGNHQYLAEPFVLNIRGGNDGYLRGASVNEPLQAITTEPAMALVEPFVLGQQSQGRARSTKKPLPTIAADGAIALIEPYIVPVNHGAKDTRTHSVNKPMPTVMGFDSLALAQPFILTMEHGNNTDASKVKSIENPMPTLTSADGFGLVEPYLVSYHGGKNGKQRTHSINAPLPTQDTSNRYGVAEPYLVEFHKSGQGVQSVEKPLPTQTTKDRFGLASPLAFVGADGQTYLLDIRFRMLQPKELAAAMSFPKDYKFAGNREKVVKQIGNAVAVNVAKALCLALLV